MIACASVVALAVGSAVVSAQEPGAPAALPEEAVTVRVRSTLETHCARCHQGGPEASGGSFTSALDLPTIARDPGLVVAGIPDASRLYLTMLDRHRPSDVFRAGNGWNGPDAEDIAAVRRWIAGLPAGSSGSVSSAEFPAAGLALSLDATTGASLKSGDVFELSAQATADCYLTLVGIDPSGQAIVLFPNDLEPDNKLVAGAARRIPGEDAGYRLRAAMGGRETVVAICSTGERPPLRLLHDYEHERFTILGDWETYLKTMLDDEAAGRPLRPKVEVRRSRRRNGQATPPAAGTDMPREARATLVFEVELSR